MFRLLFFYNNLLWLGNKSNQLLRLAKRVGVFSHWSVWLRWPTMLRSIRSNSYWARASTAPTLAVGKVATMCRNWWTITSLKICWSTNSLHTIFPSKPSTRLSIWWRKANGIITIYQKNLFVQFDSFVDWCIFLISIRCVVNFWRKTRFCSLRFRG